MTHPDTSISREPAEPFAGQLYRPLTDKDFCKEAAPNIDHQPDDRTWMDLARFLETNNIAFNNDADFAAKQILEYFENRSPKRESSQPVDCSKLIDELWGAIFFDPAVESYGKNCRGFRAHGKEVITRFVERHVRPTERESREPSGWLPMEALPEWDKRPTRQIIYIEGSRHHSGMDWHRPHTGEAYISNADDNIQGYRREDIARLCRDGDIALGTVRVKAWKPFICLYPEIPRRGSE